MAWEAWVTLAVVVSTVGMLASERLAPAITVAGAVVVLLLLGVIDEKQAFAGFSNAAPITVAALYVLAGAAEITGAIEPVTARLLAPGRSDRSNLVRIVVPTTAMSAFLNNTPIVAVVAPQVSDWARRIGRPASRFLMPVSFASILGGVVTLMGTSTNLVVSGLLEESGRPALGLFELSRVGLPVAVIGSLFLIAAAPRLLPDRRGAREALGAEAKEFTLEMIVQPGSELSGRSVQDGGLRHLEGVFLVQVEREGRIVAPVAPSEILEDGDRLTFAGNVGQVLDLHRMRGLVSAEQPHFDLEGSGHRFYEVVLGPNSPVSGQTLRDVGFRGRYGAAVVAIHRAGARVAEKLGRVTLRAGDVLLVLGDADFRERWRDRHDFLVISPLEGTPPTRSAKAPVVGLIALGVIVVAGSGLLPLLQASLAAAVALVLFGVLTPGEARRAIDLDVLVMIAASFGLGAAIATSGLADELASLISGGLDRFGDLGALAGVLIATVALTELITNNAAAALMFPIAISTAQHAGMDPRGFAIAVAVGASASFLTPVGYQTNTMVYGMGGYRFGDFARLGGTLTIVTMVAALLLIPIGWPLR